MAPIVLAPSPTDAKPRTRPSPPVPRRRVEIAALAVVALAATACGKGAEWTCEESSDCSSATGDDAASHADGPEAPPDGGAPSSADGDAGAVDPGVDGGSGSGTTTCGAGNHVCGAGCYPDGDWPTTNPSDTCIVSEAFGVFVSSSLGSDATGAGTRSKPYGSIAKGIAAAAAAKKRLYVCAETYHEAETDALASDVSIFGYFTCTAAGAWAVGTGHAVVTAPSSVDRAVTATDVTNARLESIEWDSPSQPAGSSRSSYAMFAVGSTLTLVDVSLVAGAGGSGADSASLGAAPIGPKAPCPAGDGRPSTATGANGRTGTAAWSIAGYAPAYGADGSPGGNGDDGTLATPGCCANQTCSGSGFNNCAVVTASSSCGGAGTAGCGGPGGAGGKGGAGGGASVALFAWGSTIGVTGGALSSSNGGNGGAGAAGAAAPASWPSAAGSTGSSVSCHQWNCGSDVWVCQQDADATGAGGVGGAGGRGANGGAGAGGSGGDTYSYYEGGGSTITADETVSTKQGAAGVGQGAVPGKAGYKGVFNTAD